MPAAAELEDEYSCALYAPVMRSGTSMDAPTAAEPAELSELTTSSFALISIDRVVAAGQRPFPLPSSRVRLLSPFPEGWL